MTDKHRCRDCARFVMQYEEEGDGACNIKGGVKANHPACDKFERGGNKE